MTERYTYKETEKNPEIPNFFVCTGVSGAGATTAVKQIESEGYAQFGPPHFTTRPLRPNERSGDQYYSVTRETLAKIPQQIVLQKHLSNNEYGIFIPAVNSIRRKLDLGSNVILDSIHAPAEWKAALGASYAFTSVFFAPRDPETAIQRIVRRAKQSNDTLLKQYLPVRIKEDARHILQIREYDYWIDTTDLEEIKPALIAAILTRSFNQFKLNDMLFEVSSSEEEIEEVIKSYEKRGQKE